MAKQIEKLIFHTSDGRGVVVNGDEARNLHAGLVSQNIKCNSIIETGIYMEDENGNKEHAVAFVNMLNVALVTVHES